MFKMHICLYFLFLEKAPARKNQLLESGGGGGGGAEAQWRSVTFSTGYSLLKQRVGKGVAL